MKKIIISLSIISAVAALAIVGTVAYFSDTETSTGNLLQAGSLDLKVDSTCHYWQDNGHGYVDVGCTGGTWSETDLTVEKFFNFTDIKPGDKGENTISLHPVDNDANICAYVTNLVNQENGCNEPEGKVDASCGGTDPVGVGLGELQGAIHMKIWRDKGTNDHPGWACDNVWQPGEYVYVEDAVVDSNTGPWDLGWIKGNKNVCLGVAWNVPTTVGNIIQSDSISGDISFYAEQTRNNPNFVCPPQLPVEPKPITRVDRTQPGFGDGGWAGWSCPAGTTAVGGGIDSSTNPVGGHGVAAPGAPAVDTYNYPVYPHYTFNTGAGETGYVVHDLPDGLGNTISFHIDCQVN
jgi:predicted ribosomally synthesized peptide with SipW-like signal peptide